MTTQQIHTRNIPSDADPEIVRAAAEKRTDPAFIERPGFSRCPRCSRCWPEDYFKPNHASFPSYMAQARCIDCRRGEARYLRAKAVEAGICEARSCSAPIVEQYKCAHHVALAAQAHARRRAEKLAAK